MTCWNFKSKIRHALEDMAARNDGEVAPIRKILATKFRN
jgi:hypothetical protein